MTHRNDRFRAFVNQVKQAVSIVKLAEDAGIALRHEGSCYKGLCPFHDDSATDSFALYEHQGRWRCYGACQTGGDTIDLYMRLHGVKFSEAVRELARRFGIAEPSPPTPLPGGEGSQTSRLRHLWPYDRAEAVYVYPIDGGGEAHEVRYVADGRKKSVLCRPSEEGLIYGLSAGEYYFSAPRRGGSGACGCWRRVNKKTPRGATKKTIAGARVGLYRPEVLKQARAGEDWVYLVEGPKDAETAIGLGLYATTCVNGAGGLKHHQAEELRGHLVAVVGDHDDAGEKGAEKRAMRLRPVAREVRVLPPLGGTPGSGYDLSDYVADRRREGASDAEIVDGLRELLRARRPRTTTETLPEIEVTPREKEVNDAALEALAESEPNLFQRFGSLVHVIRTEAPSDKKAAILRSVGSPVIRTVPEGRLREVLADRCRFVKTRYERGRETKVDVHPPQWTTRALLARGEWDGVEHLEAVVECPVIRADGSVLQEPGFDAKTGLFYLPSADYEAVPAEPDARCVEASLELLREVVCDFPFQAEAHFSAWLSALLTPLARFAFSGPSPLNLIDANIRGAGKSLLADVCNMIVAGRPAARMSYHSHDESELRKAITSVALAGDRIVLIDNIRGAFGDATLDRALTATTWKDRLLGGNTAVELPLDMTWYATGNNVTLSGDTPRRCLHIRLESPEERPEERTDFRHPNLLAWIAQERKAILPASLVLLRAWWAAGRRRLDLPGLGSYESWSDTVRQAVVWLGLPDPAETRLELEEAADVEAAAVSSLILNLEELLDAPHLSGEATAREILATLESASAEEWGSLREAFSELVPRLKSGQLPTTRQLGVLLRKHRGKYVGGACLVAVRERSKSGALWAVRRRQATSQATLFHDPETSVPGDPPIAPRG